MLYVNVGLYMQEECAACVLQKREGSLLSSDASPDWDAQTFLVCIYVDVSTDQPYVILQSSTSSTALDVVSQVKKVFPRTI